MFKKIRSRIKDILNNRKTDKQIVGKIGEDAVCKYLKNKGFSIIERNYLKKCGELDIIAKKQDIIHFIEVKSVSREIGEKKRLDVSRDTYNPEDNIHQWKRSRLRKTIETYILEKDFNDNQDWQCDIAIVYIDMSKRISRVSLIEDIVF